LWKKSSIGMNSQLPVTLGPGRPLVVVGTLHPDIKRELAARAKDVSEMNLIGALHASQGLYP
jgi:hypothetical protein